MTFYQWLAGSHGSGSLTAVNGSHFSCIAWSCPSLTTPRHSPVASSFQLLIIFSLLFCFTSFSEILSDESWICYLQPKTLVCVLSFSFVIVRDSPGTPSSVCPIAFLFPRVSLREFFFGHFVYYQFFFSYFIYSLLFIFLFLYWYYLHYFILPFFFLNLSQSWLYIILKLGRFEMLPWTSSLNQNTDLSVLEPWTDHGLIMTVSVFSYILTNLLLFYCLIFFDHWAIFASPNLMVRALSDLPQDQYLHVDSQLSKTPILRNLMLSYVQVVCIHTCSQTLIHMKGKSIQ